MKKIIFIIVTTFSIISLNAQEKTITIEKGQILPESLEKGVVYKVPEKESQKFEGVWTFKDENSIFKIKVKSEKSFSKSTGNYVYILKGVFCYSKTNTSCDFNDANNIFFYESELDKLFGTKINYFLSDSGYNKNGKVTFELLEDSTAKWLLNEREAIRVISPEGKKKRTGFSIPTDIILTKEE